MQAGEVQLDVDRESRLGFDEAIFSARKSDAQIREILAQAEARGSSVLLTRLAPAQHALIPETHRRRIDYDQESRTGFFAWEAPLPLAHKVALVSAGSSDAPIIAEAARTLEYYGVLALRVHDVGVAGLWRLMARLDEIRACPVTIVAAGMDGALPSVVGGLIGSVVIALPTSIGYGAARAGETALCAALASCAPGLLVVNIDNGYGAACAALRVLRMIQGCRPENGEETGKPA